MAGGWSRDGAVQDQIDQSVADAVEHARQALAGGVSRSECEDCGEPIPEARRAALPGVRRCVPCQEAHDADERFQGTFNRRGSKDSQLR
ncbi:MAG: DksA/TraR family C4-type zinc finger protein [Gammaproteobacteria bacterium]|jgi:phage/conjugal plasmid C-4 type zinc finger TraR family protein